MKERGIGTWAKGINNRAAVDKLPDGSVRHLINFDPVRGGGLSLRTGYEQKFAGTNARGMLALGDRLLIADGPNLIELDTRTGTSRLIRAIAGAGPLVGDVVDGVLYFCTANECLEYNGSTIRTWGVPDVSQQPTVTPVSNGALLEGYYRVAMVYVDADGREGGTDLPVTIFATAGQGLAVTVPALPAGCMARIYASVNSGESLYLQAEAITATTVVLTALRDDTLRCGTILNKAPTPGTSVVAHNGVLAISAGHVVMMTRPMRPHLVDRSRGFIQYGADVGMMVSTVDALFVSADKTYAVVDPETDGIRQLTVLEFPAVPGTAVTLPDGRGAWMSSRGQVVTDKTGVSLISDDDHAPIVSERGAAGVLDHNGNQLIITTLAGADRANPLAATDFYIGEILNP